MSVLIYGFHSINSYIKPKNNSNKDIKQDNSSASFNSIEIVYFDDNRQDIRQQQLLNQVRELGIPVSMVTTEELNKLTKVKTHQGVAAKVKRVDLGAYTLKDVLLQIQDKDNARVLILDGITDPHNLGAIIRSCDCFGIDAVILPKNNSANVDSPIVVKTSSGAVNNIPIITVNNLSRAMEDLKDNGFWIAGTGLGEGCINLFEFKFSGKLAWVMGSEGSGMRRLVREHCDYLVTIPMLGNTQSLNVSVAAGIVLAHTAVYSS
ncbi:MAG: rRNA (guanosine2251-2-O)-methyltransferase [Pseudomonadota bacterium]|nr:rRNA (guanosine2251-2-O)-methyltransferase [Pseudomonadota bacterium]